MDRNIYLEGVPGSGKSTLLGMLEREYPECRCCREGDLSPVELAWCAYLDGEQYRAALAKYPGLAPQIKANTAQEGEQFIVAYTRVKAEDGAFYPFMEQYELYGGRRSEEEFRRIVLERLAAFTDRGYVFECSFFQNIIDELLLFRLYSTERIVAFYREMTARMNLDAFRLIRLTPRDLAASLDHVRRERVDDQGRQAWYEAMLDYLAGSPYGVRRGGMDFDGLLEYFRARMAAEDAVLGTLPAGCFLNVRSREYALDDVIAFLERT